LAPFREMGSFPEVLISRAPSRSAPLKELVALRQFYLVLSEVCGFREVRPEEVHPEDQELPPVKVRVSKVRSEPRPFSERRIMDCHWTLEDLGRASLSRCRGTVHRFLALFISG
jgi:hypothetical protein